MKRCLTTCWCADWHNSRIIMCWSVQHYAKLNLLIHLFTCKTYWTFTLFHTVDSSTVGSVVLEWKELCQLVIERAEVKILEAVCGVLSSDDVIVLSVISGMRRTHDSHSTCMRRQISGKWYFHLHLLPHVCYMHIAALSPPDIHWGYIHILIMYRS